MSVFGSIVSTIFGSKHAAGVTPAATPSSSAPSSTGTTAPSSSPSSTSAAAPPVAPAPAATAKPISRADVEAILQKVAAEVREDLDWRKSIVDLMKLLKLDSGLGARKQLAQELGYTGALDGPGGMSRRLHGRVRTSRAERCGSRPDSRDA